MVLSKVGIDAGQFTWHERHAVHDQTASSSITLSSKSLFVRDTLCGPEPLAFKVLNEFLGESGFLLKWAGHLS